MSYLLPSLLNSLRHGSCVIIIKITEYFNWLAIEWDSEVLQIFTNDSLLFLQLEVPVLHLPSFFYPSSVFLTLDIRCHVRRPSWRVSQLHLYRVWMPNRAASQTKWWQKYLRQALKRDRLEGRGSTSVFLICTSPALRRAWHLIKAVRTSLPKRFSEKGH